MRVLSNLQAPPALRPEATRGVALPSADAMPSEEPRDSVVLEDPPRALTLGQRLGTMGMAALSLLGGVVATSATVEANETRPVPAKVAPSLDTWLLSGGEHVARWPAAEPARAPAVPERAPEVLTMAEPEAARRAPTVSRQEKARPGDYVRHGVNFSNLLSDAEFIDWQALSVGEIQDLLEGMDSFLADYSVGGESAAQAIGRISRENEVNPWLLLATLEKESSMVTREKAPPVRRLRAAMGYGYHDGGGTAGKSSNLSSQLEKGAHLLRELFDEGRTLSFPQKMKVDYGKRKIQVRNAATWALVKYTPHTVDTRLSKVGGGNFLFRRHYERFQKLHAQMFEGRQADRAL